MSVDCCGSVHLVGSFPTSPDLKTPADVFDVAGPALGKFAARLPDGEPQGWLNFSNDSFNRAVGVERLPDKDPGLTPPWAQSKELKELLLDPEVLQKAMGPAYRIKPGKGPDDVKFAPTGYIEIATESYKLFAAAREDGRIAPGTKFQQSMPTPNVMLSSFLPQDAEALRPTFEQHLFDEVRAICEAIPHKDLAFQWDCVEVSMIEAGLPTVEAGTGYAERDDRGAPIITPEALSRDAELIARAIDAVPASVEMGLHLCYGNAGGRHAIQPADTSVMVAFANAFLPLAKRSVSWIHMPVPIDRDDASYFRPLRTLDLPVDASLFLGLVHPSDGIDGATRRILAAKQFAPDFGVATECGLRFFDDFALADILQLHRDAAQVAKS